MLEPTSIEKSRRDQVMSAIIDDIQNNRVIKLPDFDPEFSRPSEKALLTVGVVPNPYNGTIGPYRYQFEGEEDLLHLIITRSDEEMLSPMEGQSVASFLLDGVPTALIWLKPGEKSQHFYVGHDELIGSIQL